MNKVFIILPLFLLTMCSDAPVTPPAHACSPRLDGKPTYCPDERDLILIPREQVKGEVDVWNINHWHQMQMMFERNMYKGRIEKQATRPSDAINKALTEFKYGSDDTTQSEELLQLPSD